MNLATLPYLLPYLLSLSISLGVGVYALRRRRVAGAGAFGMLGLLQAAYTLGYTLELVSPTLQAKHFWDDFQYLPTISVSIALLYFALRYTNRRLSFERPLRLALAGWVVGFTALVYTNESHHLLSSNPRLLPGHPFDLLTYDFGPGTWVMALIIYIQVLAGLYLLLSYSWRSAPIYRRRAIVIAVGMAIPLAGSLLTLAGLDINGQRDISPFTFAIGNLLMAVALFRYRLFEIVPVAHSLLVESMPEALLVLDDEARVVDLNPTARRLLRVGENWRVGQPADQLFAAWPELVETYRGVMQAETELAVTLNGQAAHFFLSITPLHDRQGRKLGRMILLRDITARKQAEAALQTYQEKLEQMVEQRTAALQQEVLERQRAEVALKEYQENLECLVEERTAELARQRTGRGGQPGQDAVPLAHEPRAAHPAQRHPGLCADPQARRQPERAPGRRVKRDPEQRRAPADSDRRCARPGQDRGRAPGAAPGPGQPAGAAGAGCQPGADARPPEGPAL
jgi:PAS domain S-box-containing protein